MIGSLTARDTGRGRKTTEKATGTIQVRDDSGMDEISNQVSRFILKIEINDGIY